MEGESHVQPTKAVAEDRYKHTELHETVRGMRSRFVDHVDDSHDYKDHADGDHGVKIENEAPFSAAMKFGVSSCSSARPLEPAI